MAAHLFFRRRDAPEILRLRFGASAAPSPMVEHIAKLHDLGVDVVLLRFESSDCGVDNFLSKLLWHM